MNSITDPIAPMVIEIDSKNSDKDNLNIKIPILPPKIFRDYSKLNDLEISNFNFIKAEIKEFIADEKAEIVFRDLIKNEFDHSIQLNANTSLDYRSVIGFYAQNIMKELKLSGVYDIVYGKLKSFIKNYLFINPVDLDNPIVLRNIVETKQFKTIMESFKKGINEVTVQTNLESYIKDYIEVDKTRPFVVKNQESIIPQKSVFNKIVGNNPLELDFANFLEKCDDIISYTKNYLAVHFNIDYQNSEGEISNYYPDFIVKKTEKEIYIIETKGNENINDVYKINRLEQWCDDINNIQNDIHCSFLYVSFEQFYIYKPANFNNLIEFFKGKKPSINDKYI
jgi:type III restriction enzyme